MNPIICFVAFLILSGLFIFISLLVVLMVDSIARGHDLPTSGKPAKIIIKIISQHKNTGIFYDLGCAHGALAIRIKRTFPALSVRAIDNDPIRIFFAKIGALIFRANISFLRKNIFDTDLGDADIVYAYLWYDIMPPLEKKLRKELKRGAIVITNTSNFPTWKPIEKIITYPKASKTPNFETLFVYRKK
jgi:SAM-dependent methyltransferase